MRSYAVGLLLLSSALQVHAYIAKPARPSNEELNHGVEKRQMLANLAGYLRKGGKVADPPGAAPKRVVLPTTSRVSGAKTIKYRLGPYSVIGMNETSFGGERGTLFNYPDFDVPKPCEECTIVGQTAGLEYADGTNANIDAGLWLHHMVQFIIGPDRWDPTCIGGISFPHGAVGSRPDRSERYFSSGNERSKGILEASGTTLNGGWWIRKEDRFAVVVDLMNMNMEPKTVYMTMYYDVVDGPLPKGWKEVKSVWFDIRQCGTSEAAAPQQTGSYKLLSGHWTPNFEGDLLGTAGHLHDGGSHIKIMAAPGLLFCDSVAGYGETPEYINEAAAHGDMGGQKSAAVGATKHISSMSKCQTLGYNEQGEPHGLAVNKLSKNQSWYLEAHYDYDRYPGMLDDGYQSPVMGISILLTAIEPGTRPTGSSSVGLLSAFLPWGKK